MWVFCREGGVSIVELSPQADKRLTLHGKRNLQIRGRCEEHLQRIKDRYFEGLDTSPILHLEHTDYEYRF